MSTRSTTNVSEVKRMKAFLSILGGLALGGITIAIIVAILKVW